MKTSIIVGLATAWHLFGVQAEQSLVCPEKDPLISFTLPDDWKTQMKHGSLLWSRPMAAM